MEEDILEPSSLVLKFTETSSFNLNLENYDGIKLITVPEASVTSPIRAELIPFKPEPVPTIQDLVLHNNAHDETASFSWPSLWKNGPRRSAFQPYKPSREPPSSSAGPSLSFQQKEQPPEDASPKMPAEPPRPTSTTYMTNLQRGNVQTETVASTEMSWFTLVGRGDVTAEQVQEMIVQGKDIDCVDEEGLSGLMWAAFYGQIYTVQVLLEAGNGTVQVNRVGLWGETALMLAATEGHLEIVRLLINAGADVNYEDHEQNTALMCAVYNDHAHIVNELLVHGADICVENSEESTAFDIAVNQKSLRSKAVLEKFMYALLMGS